MIELFLILVLIYLFFAFGGFLLFASLYVIETRNGCCGPEGRQDAARAAVSSLIWPFVVGRFIVRNARQFVIDAGARK